MVGFELAQLLQFGSFFLRMRVEPVLKREIQLGKKSLRRLYKTQTVSLKIHDRSDRAQQLKQFSF